MRSYFKHESSYVDDGAIIGSGTKIWHFSHIQKAKIGERCIFGQNVNVADGVVIGNNVKVQNNVSIYTGTIIEDDVFLGPSCVLTNVTNPRSQINRHSLYEKTLIRRGATIGANATIVCGVTLGRYCFIAAGSVVTKDVPDYALMVGNPARQKGWMSRHGHILKPETLHLAPETLHLKPETLNLAPETLHLAPKTLNLAPETSLSPSPLFICPESGFRYQIVQSETLNLAPETSPSPSLRCLDLDEEAPLPPELTQGAKTYEELKR